MNKSDRFTPAAKGLLIEISTGGAPMTVAIVFERLVQGLRSRGEITDAEADSLLSVPLIHSSDAGSLLSTVDLEQCGATESQLLDDAFVGIPHLGLAVCRAMLSQIRYQCDHDTRVPFQLADMIFRRSSLDRRQWYESIGLSQVAEPSVSSQFTYGGSKGFLAWLKMYWDSFALWCIVMLRPSHCEEAMRSRFLSSGIPPNIAETLARKTAHSLRIHSSNRKR